MNPRPTSMTFSRPLLILLVALLAAGLCACRGAGDPSATGEEESGVELALDEGYDAVRNGARLVLRYDAASNSFDGTVENTTEQVLKQVRVEVHLSNGVELGPTTPADLGPGESLAVRLVAGSNGFDCWTAHPEVGEGGGEHGEEGEGDDEHGGEGEGDSD